MKTKDEWVRKAAKLLKDIRSIPFWRLNDNQAFEFTLFGPHGDESWSELDVIEKALEHFTAHLKGDNPCPDSIPLYIVSKQKGKTLEKRGKARRLGRKS